MDNSIEISPADQKNLDELSQLVSAYHAFESIHSNESSIERALLPLLASVSDVGFILIASKDNKIVGYIAICFGYSIELKGRDAFIDELFVLEEYRNKGLGKALIERAKIEARLSRITTLHLEVSRKNSAAKRFYSRQDFEAREQYHLMSCSL